MLGRNGPNVWVGPAKKKELSRGPLAKGGRDRGAAAAMALRATVLTPRRRDEGRNGFGRWLWTPPALRRGRSGPHRSLSGRNRGSFCDFGRFGGSSGPAGIAGSQRALPGLARLARNFFSSSYLFIIYYYY
ncbi:hypothetical protein CRG98_010468 [Punica granatum]|uniref:Uncharacterized protein n=1 Tax=Punica granatum TaxID=22663 RepID=A0A2I0KLL1_PUNGR|nr:hypothetical protein CRG98_010468 [Punica granatum]